MAKKYILVDTLDKIESFFSGKLTPNGPIVSVLNERDARKFTKQEANIIAFDLNRGSKKWKARKEK